MTTTAKTKNAQNRLKKTVLTAIDLKKRLKCVSWLQILATKPKMMLPNDSHHTKPFSNMPITHFYVALRERKKKILKSAEIFSFTVFSISQTTSRILNPVLDMIWDKVEWIQNNLTGLVWNLVEESCHKRMFAKLNKGRIENRIKFLSIGRWGRYIICKEE